MTESSSSHAFHFIFPVAAPQCAANKWSIAIEAIACDNRLQLPTFNVFSATHRICGGTLTPAWPGSAFFTGNCPCLTEAPATVDVSWMSFPSNPSGGFGLGQAEVCCTDCTPGNSPTKTCVQAQEGCLTGIQVLHTPTSVPATCDPQSYQLLFTAFSCLDDITGAAAPLTLRAESLSGAFMPWVTLCRVSNGMSGFRYEGLSNCGSQAALPTMWAIYDPMNPSGTRLQKACVQVICCGSFTPACTP